ncbi:MAG TPA: biotin--[acetyl-CoA-carboxylase] ligase [Terriglobales bacterium]|nr:biotin--[acetyl-CoA-carboxylase] ligase [Terriglobales bacterium]
MSIPARDYDVDELESALAGSPFSHKVHYIPETGSTNTLAMHAGAAGVEEGHVFFTDRQTAGRGRGGHLWQSESGSSILASILLRPRIQAAQALWLSLMAGLAVHDAILNNCGIACDLRWPNDLLIARKKVCGILTEISSDAEHLRFAVIGIGVNLNQDSFPAEIADIATSIQIETGKTWSRAELLVAMLQSLEANYRKAIVPEGTRTLIARVESVSSYARGKQVHVDEAEGYDGVTDGLDANGFLRVRTQSGIRKVLSGGVREVSA